MFRGVIFALVACAAALATTITSYEPGHDYLYKYEVITTSALRAANHQTAGLKIRTNVRLQFNAEKLATLKLEDPEMCKVNQEVPAAETVETVFEHSCTPMIGPEADFIIEQLVKPFIFKWENGISTELRADSEDAFWSLNIKRGLVNLLNLNLKEENEIEPLFHLSANVIEQWQLPIPSEELKPLFRAYEKDMVGECETIYSITEKENTPSILYVNKVRNYDNCKTKPMYRMGWFSNFHDIYPEVKESTAIKTLSHVDYKLEGTRDQYLIKSAYLTNHFSLRPFENVESAYTSTRQKLTLLEVTATAVEIALPSNLEVLPILQFDIPLELSSAIPAHEKPFTDEAVEYYTTMIDERLEEIVNITPEDMDESISTKILRISRALEMIPFTHVQTIVNKYLSPIEDDPIVLKKREVMLDIIPTLTRTDLIPLFTNLVKKEIISVPRTIIMINMLALTAKPSPKMFEDLMVLARDDFVAGKPLLKRTVLLTTGIIANKIRTMYTEMNISETITIPEIHKITESYITLLNEANDETEKMEICAYIGNAGLLELFPTIENIIKDPSTPSYVKSKAIFALRKIANVIPLKVQHLLLPIYADTNEKPHVRVACFLIIMKTNPSAGVIDVVTNELKKESNIEVLSFVTSYLKNIVTSEDPRMHNMTLKIENALEGIHLVHGGLLNSGVYKLEKFIKSAGPIGADIRMTLFNNGVTPAPETGIFEFKSAFFGKKFDITQMGIMTSGLKDLFWNLFGPENRYDDFMEGRATFEDILKPLTELASKFMSGIELKYPTAERQGIAEKMVEFYTKIFDYELFSVKFQDEEFVELFNTVKSYLPEIISTLRDEYPLTFTKTLATPNAGIMLPTPAGIPITLDVNAVAHMHFQGKFQLDGTHGISTILQYLTGTMAPITLRTEIRPSTVASIFVSLGTKLPSMQSCVVVRTDVVNKVSTKTEFTVMPTDKKIKFTIEPPKVDTNVAKITNTPLTAFVLTPIRPTIENRPAYELNYLNSVPTIEWTTPIIGQGIGFPVQLLTEIPSLFSLLRPDTLLVSEMWAELKFLPSLGTPEKFEFEMKYYAPGEEPKTATATVSKESYSWFSSSSYRTTPHDVTGLSFDAVRPEEGLDQSTARFVMITISSRTGENVDKEIKLRLAHMMDLEYLKHQFNFQLLSSPLFAETNSPLKAEFNAVVFIPEFINKFMPNSPVFTEPELLSKAEVKMGFTDKIEKISNVQVFWKRDLNPINTPTVSGLMESTSQYTFTKHIPVSYRNVSALQGIVNATLLNKMFHEEPTNMALVFTTEIDYTPENVPVLLKWALPTIREFALHVPYLFSEKASVITWPAWNDEHTIKLTTILDPFLTEVRFSLEMPTLTTTVHGLPLPLPYLFKKMIQTPAWPLVTSQLMEGDIPAGYCSVTPNNYIHTFDMLSSKLPNSMCEMVLAKDCSALNIFLVTMKPTETGKKLINMYLPGYKIEIIPTTNAVTIKINGEITGLPYDNTPYIIREEATGTEILRLLSKSSTVLITSWKYGLTLETDCISAFIKPSDLYRGQLCGACSNFAASLHNELRGPNMELYNTPQEFLSSYTIQSEGCNVPLRSTTCQAVERNIVFERFVNGVQSICVSSVPINQCSGSCQPTEPHQITQAFHCQPYNLPSARRLRSRAEDGPITLTQESADHHETLTEYQTCAPAN